MIKNLFTPSQFKKNIISGSFIHGLNIIIIFISYPIYIKYLGFELFSIWAALSIVIAFAKMGEFGISKAIISNVSKDMENSNETHKIVYNAFYILLAVSAVIMVVLITLKTPIVAAINVPAAYVAEAVSIIPLLAVAIVTYLLYDMFGGVIAGKNRLDIVNFLLLVNNVIKVILSVILLAKGLSLLAIVYGIIITNVALIVVQICLIIFKFKIPIYIPAPFQKKYIKKLLDFGSSIMGMQVFNMLSIPLIKIILSNSMGIESVGIFELAQKSAYSLRSLFEKGLFAIMPDISSLSARVKENRKDVIFQRVLKITKLLTLFSIPFFILISAFAPLWLKLWLGASYSVTILHGFWLLQPGIIIGLIVLPAYYALMGTNNHRYCLWESIIRALLTVILCSLFLFFELQIFYSFIFVSLSVVVSNLYIVYGFNMKYRK